jgi:flagellar biosynthesis protein FlhF
MRIKRYVVNDMHEAFQRIKEDLGKDAIILSSSKVRAKGVRGFLGGTVLEVTAALDRGEDRQAAFLPTAQVSQLVDDNHRIEKELGEVKVMLKRILNSTSQNDSPFVRWKDVLESLEINSEIADEIIYGLAEGAGEEVVNDNLMKEALKGHLTRLFQEIEPRASNYKLHAFVGPTGVGKTTTLAKLAAQNAFSMGKKVGLITIDTYRIGAVEQLRTYGNIMGVDVDVVMTPEQLHEAVRRNADKDVVFIDTAGRSPSDSMKLSEVRTFLDAVKPLEVYLVLSLTTKKHDLDRIAEDYRVLDYTSLIFTKVDETETYGSILNVAYSNKIPVAYLTNGQDVPEDIETAEPWKLAELILGEVVKDGSS